MTKCIISIFIISPLIVLNIHCAITVFMNHHDIQNQNHYAPVLSKDQSSPNTPNTWIRCFLSEFCKQIFKHPIFLPIALPAIGILQLFHKKKHTYCSKTSSLRMNQKHKYPPRGYTPKLESIKEDPSEESLQEDLPEDPSEESLQEDSSETYVTARETEASQQYRQTSTLY